MHEPSGLESFESGGASSPSLLESARVSWRLESLGGRVGTVVVPRAQLHTEQEKIFTSVVDTWRVGINQQYLYSIGEYLIFAWLFQRKKVACRGILTAQDSSPLDSARVSWRLESARVQVWTRLEPAREQHPGEDTKPTFLIAGSRRPSHSSWAHAIKLKPVDRIGKLLFLEAVNRTILGFL